MSPNKKTTRTPEELHPEIEKFKEIARALVRGAKKAGYDLPPGVEETVKGYDNAA